MTKYTVALFKISDFYVDYRNGDYNSKIDFTEIPIDISKSVKVYEYEDQGSLERTIQKCIEDPYNNDYLIPSKEAEENLEEDALRILYDVNKKCINLSELHPDWIEPDSLMNFVSVFIDEDGKLLGIS